jgi:hypothetical protein
MKLDKDKFPFALVAAENTLELMLDWMAALETIQALQSFAGMATPHYAPSEMRADKLKNMLAEIQTYIYAQIGISAVRAFKFVCLQHPELIRQSFYKLREHFSTDDRSISQFLSQYGRIVLQDKEDEEKFRAEVKDILQLIADDLEEEMENG